MDEFPANSNNSKINEPVRGDREERRRNLKVVKSPGIRRKKPVGARFLSLFLSGEDIKTAAVRVTLESLLPKAKDVILDAAKDFLDRIFNGDSRSSSTTGRVSYNNMGSSSGRRMDDDRGGPSRRDRALHNFDDIIFNSREDANEVIEHLYNVLDEYDHVTVGDFYTIAGVSSEPQDESWGWKDRDFRNVEAVPTRNGRYRISFPRPIPIRHR